LDIHPGLLVASSSQTAKLNQLPESQPEVAAGAAKTHRIHLAAAVVTSTAPLPERRPASI
jgi:hypothetical protein